MRLSQREFHAMNNPIRRFFQRHVELRLLRSLGLRAGGRDLLEIGCGSGYGAELLLEQGPRSYLGVDLMEEQIELARQRLPRERFEVGDATDLSSLDERSFDLIVIFGILHHIPGWRQVVSECARLLRPGGEVYLEEPGRTTIDLWDRLFEFGHQTNERFTLDQLEAGLEGEGFRVTGRRLAGFGIYRAELPDHL